jgi:glutamyl-tRNA synthetase
VSEPSAVRVRIAPSPTGLPHIGTFRTFLFNWLFARQNGGQFVIRIEDTDRERLIEGAIDALVDAVDWFGLDWDEGPRVGGPFGPYEQSERLPLYHEHVERLIADGHAYRCYCTPERLETLREEQRQRGEPPGYDRHCRDLTDAERAAHEKADERSVVRFKVPLEGTTTFKDVIHGEVTWENRVLDDFVILKSDGYPTYHLAHLVDDHVMEISHVLRGDEWIASTPRHQLLYQAFGWEPPVFAHLPTILGTDRKKLSKRHGPTGIAAFQEAGYLREAMINYLALCGWSPGTEEEIFTLDELVERFSIERINQTGAIFDHDKLDWFNGQWMRRLSPEEISQRIRPFLGELAEGVDDAYLLEITKLLQDRFRTLAEARELTEYFFTDTVPFDRTVLEKSAKVTSDLARAALEASLAVCRDLEPFTHESMEPRFRELATELELKNTQLFMTLRIAISGRTATAGLFETMQVLGRPRVVKRLSDALGHL